MPEYPPMSDSLSRYKQALTYLDGLAKSPLGLDYMRDQSRPWVFLERTKAFLDAIGNPEREFKYIHITGTSGKGTVATMTQEALVSAGKQTGLFTSPYVVAATEKIRVNDLYIAPEEFADILDQLKPYIEEARMNGPYGRPTYFEIFFAIALMYFKRQRCEWVVLEVGAGGRYDATNCILNPVVTAITNIDYDHVQILGKTLQSIADNKAGIIKEGSVFFTTEKRAALLKFFRRECERTGALYNAVPAGSDYQENNKRLVRAICNIAIPGIDIEKTLREAQLPCRFETMQEQPKVILDGAHNRAKMRSCVANLKKLHYEKLHLVFALKDDKSVSTIAREIVPLADTVIFTAFTNPTAHSIEPSLLQKKVSGFTKKAATVVAESSAVRAYKIARDSAGPKDVVLVTGSFYLAGELRREWYSEEWVVKNRKSFH